eukprot:TRINITY_DN5843_c0_g1_i3.p1 TRINITY_DN5843_c0_g1~~TRINITY_DN5843_c0_g1_i3.p1  ORF type:complete len:212 (+),score=65.98 TRINITY_DN5843_c0_g1_i3:112-747(+)
MRLIDLTINTGYMPQDPEQVKHEVMDYLLWRDVQKTGLLVLTINLIFLLAVFFRMPFTALIFDFVVVYIMVGMGVHLLQKYLKKDDQDAPEALAEGSFVYVNKETVQKIVFVVYSAARRLYSLFIDLILVKDIVNTTIAFILLLAMTASSWVVSDKATLWAMVDAVFALTFVWSKEKGRDTMENAWQKTRDTVGKAQEVIEEALKRKPKEE